MTTAVGPAVPATRPGVRWGRMGWTAIAVGTAALVLVPIALIAVSILSPSAEVWREQWATRLPGQLVATATLVVGVATVTVVLGVGLAWLVSAYEFPGRRMLGWALVLPLAVPGYILGFVTTSVFGVAGPVASWWRARLGADAWFPDVRSMPFAIATLGLTLYPYVYLLARAALRDQAGGAFLVARSLGARPGDAVRRVVMPLMRPAVAAGTAVVVMETLTDVGTVQYFGVETVSVGVFRIWRGTFDRDAASELAMLVLAFALLAIGSERILRGRARFGEAGGANAGLTRRRLGRGPGALAGVGAGAVVTLAFAAPTVQLAAWAITEQTGPRGTPNLERFVDFLGNSLVLTLTTVIVCLGLGVAVTNARRFGDGGLVGVANRIAVAGYAVPGPVVAMGVILALVGLDRLLDGIGLGLPGAVATGSFLALAYAYAVRFLAPAVTAIETGVDQVPEELTASARSLGARPSRVLGRIHLPLTRASIVTAAVLVGVDALKELPVALLLRPIGFDTLPVWVYNLASESRFEQAALPALAIIGVALVPVAVLTRRLDP